MFLRYKPFSSPFLLMQVGSAFIGVGVRGGWILKEAEGLSCLCVSKAVQAPDWGRNVGILMKKF